MQAAVGFHEHTNLGAALAEEPKFLRNVIANGVAGAGVISQKCNAHGAPP
jgi:hypothetical protein